MRWEPGRGLAGLGLAAGWTRLRLLAAVVGLSRCVVVFWFVRFLFLHLVLLGSLRGLAVVQGGAAGRGADDVDDDDQHHEDEDHQLDVLPPVLGAAGGAASGRGRCEDVRVMGRGPPGEKKESWQSSSCQQPHQKPTKKR